MWSPVSQFMSVRSSRALGRVRGAIALFLCAPGLVAAPRVSAAQGAAHVAAEVTAPDTTVVRDLPLIENPSPRPGRVLAVFLTGDGGWAMLDRSIARVLADSGISVVGFDSHA